jgi:hypothetical protein
VGERGGGGGISHRGCGSLSSRSCQRSCANSRSSANSSQDCGSPSRACAGGDYCEAGEVSTRKTEEKCTFGTRNTFCTGGGRGVEDEGGGEGGGAPDVATLEKDVRYLRQQVELVKSTFQGLKSDR